MVIIKCCMITLLFLVYVSIASAGGDDDVVVGKKQEVSYDSRSLIIDGKRELLYSGSIHYPRITPDKWPEILHKAKKGGLNIIQTYVFWNVHEPEKGKFNFEGNYDLVKFIKLIQEHGMYVTLRVGPFIQAEWNHGGLPYWLREVPKIIFRCDNEPFKYYMEKYVTMIIDLMKKEKLFAPQGGPIVLAQIGMSGENNKIFTSDETSSVKWATKENGPAPAISWFKASFQAPEGNDPVVAKMSGMKKGMVWINGKSIGRYWMSFLSPLGQPTQSEYHIPRSFIKPSKNLIVVFEEEPGTLIENIEIMTVNRDTICSYIEEFYPPDVKSWARKGSKITKVVDLLQTGANLDCPDNKVVSAVEFASFGDEVDGVCGNFAPGKCTSPASKEVVEKLCVGKPSCIVPMDKGLFIKGQDACPDIKKHLAIQLKCVEKA
ncbi:hypothetical protein ACFE04_015461 [Oxalis oulophora]